MKSLNFNCLLIAFTVFSCLSVKASAQSDDSAKIGSQVNDLAAVGRQVNECLDSSLQFSAFKDSVAVYGFAFKIELRKVNGKAVVTALTVNDSLAEKIFPQYQLLKEVDYAAVLVGKTKATVIQPVFLVLQGKHRNEEELIVPIANIADNILKVFNYDKITRTPPTNDIYLTPMVSILNLSVYH